MSVQIYETESRVFEVVTEPDDPGYIRRTCEIRQLSGPPLTDEEWGRIKEAVVRQLIDAGCHVYGVDVMRDDDQTEDE